LGDAADQAAWLAGVMMTSTPLWNLTPRTTFGNWFSPFSRRQLRNPVQRGHRFQRKADSNPVIADSR